MALAKRSLHLTPNPDLSVDSRYAPGDKPLVTPASLGIDLVAFTAANINLFGRPQGTAVSVNYRTYLTGTSASTATLTVNAVSGTLGAWGFDAADNNLTNPGTTTSNLTLQVSATDGVTIVSFPIQPASIVSVSTGGQKKKWRPGHAGGFINVIRRGDTLARVKSEIDAMAPYANIQGYLGNFTWASLEPTPGESDTSATYPNGYATGAALIKSIYDYLAAMTPPRDLTVKLNVGSFTTTHPGATDYSIIPQYIQTDSTYGASGYRVAGTVTNVPAQHGWWGGDGNGNTYTACIHRSAVMNRLIKLVQTLGAYFDGLPYFYGWSFDENSFIIGGSSANSCPDFNSTAADTQLRNYVSQCIGTFPMSHFLFENSFAGTGQLSQAFMDFEVQNGVVQSNTDVLGFTYSTAHNGNPYSWGMQAYVGAVPSGATGTPTNYMAQGYPCMPEVQATDMGAFGQFGGGYTPQDILKELNVVLGASRVWWTILTGNASSYGAIKPGAVWSQLGPYLNDPANALTNTAYPSAVKGYT